MGGGAAASAVGALPPHAGLDGGLAFSEWLEALMRVALYKVRAGLCCQWVRGREPRVTTTTPPSLPPSHHQWYDAAMASSEKLARVIDALAVRLSSLSVETEAYAGGNDPLLKAAAQRVAAAEKAANAARIAARVGLMGGGGGGGSRL
jgi:hypothetical protein